MPGIERQPRLYDLVKELGTGKNASWNTTMAFLKDSRIAFCPVQPADPFRPFWPPKPSQQKEEEWARQYEMLGQYASGTNQIEKKHGVTREFVRQKKDRALVGLQQASSSQVQDQYPLESLGTRRPKERGEALLKIKSGEWGARMTQEYFDGLSRRQINRLLTVRFLTPIARLIQDSGIVSFGVDAKTKDVVDLLKKMGIAVAVSKPYVNKRGYAQVYHGVLTGKIVGVEVLLKSEVFDTFRKGV